MSKFVKLLLCFFFAIYCEENCEAQGIVTAPKKAVTTKAKKSTTTKLSQNVASTMAQSQQATSKVVLSPVTGRDNDHDYVDLGLSVKWATVNIGGAEIPDFGRYYAWGETSTKASYDTSNCEMMDMPIKDISGNNKFDVAQKLWGGNWRIPNETEINELMDKCTWSITTFDGKKGYKIKGPNGNSIFMPLNGYYTGHSKSSPERGYYWSSTANDKDKCKVLGFDEDRQFIDDISRRCGLSIRAVSGDPIVQPSVSDMYGMENGHEWVDLGLPSHKKWASMNIGASTPEDPGTFYCWGRVRPFQEADKGNGLFHHDISGTIYDTACHNWGENWRMPNANDWEELFNHCKAIDMAVDGKECVKLTGVNGTSIIIPRYGWLGPDGERNNPTVGCYWTSVPGSMSGFNACHITIYGHNLKYRDISKSYGMLIRPIKD